MDLTSDGMLIIRTLAYALRHNPTQFNLALDAEGWASIDQLVNELRFVRYDWAFLDWARIERTINGSDRFEVHAGKIRAAYGHTIELEKPPAIAEPPEFLFHGTAAESIPEIMTNGLNPMGRRFVHLSSDINWVLDFLLSKPQWALLRILARQAFRGGVCFRQANRHVWLADPMSAPFVRIESAGAGADRLH